MILSVFISISPKYLVDNNTLLSNLSIQIGIKYITNYPIRLTKNVYVDSWILIHRYVYCALMECNIWFVYFYMNDRFIFLYIYIHFTRFITKFNCQRRWNIFNGQR